MCPKSAAHQNALQVCTVMHSTWILRTQDQGHSTVPNDFKREPRRNWGVDTLGLIYFSGSALKVIVTLARRLKYSLGTHIENNQYLNVCVQYLR